MSSTATLSNDPSLYIFTSLTAGSSHIVTATSRLETILRANRVPFKALDISTDDKARMLWRRRAGQDAEGRPRKFPALVQEGLVLGDIVEIEEWNEYGELKKHVKIYYDEHTIPDIHHKHPAPKMKRPNLLQKASTAAGSFVGKKLVPKAEHTPPSSNMGSPAPENPPPAPDLSKAGALDLNKTASAPAAPEKAKEQEQKKDEREKKKETLPMRSVADEAAQKAKELRSKTLREKVHGKGAGDKKDGVNADKTGDAVKSQEEKTVEIPKNDGEGASTPGLQSPTSGKWKSDPSAPAPGDAQSPKSSSWRPAVAGTSQEGTKKVGGTDGTAAQQKKETDGPKKPDVDDDDSDEDDEDDSDEDDSEEESEDEEDSDEASDSDEKKPAGKPELPKEAPTAPVSTEKK